MRTGAEVLVSALVSMTGAHVAPATLAKGDRVSIVSRGTADAGRRAFMLRFARAVHSPDAGESLRVVETRRVDALAGSAVRRRLSGTDVLHGARGSLTLRWSAEQVRENGRWDSIAGRWSVVAASDAYSGCVGSGELTADPRFQVTVYRGRLITTV